MTKRILATGGTSKTGSRFVKQLNAKGVTPRIATRNPKAGYNVRFQWQDSTSFENTFRDIQTVYLVAPTDTFDSIGAMQLDQNISHKRLSTEGIAKRFTDLDFPKEYAATLATMDETIASGSVGRITDRVNEITGQVPNSFEHFVHHHRGVWNARADNV